MTTIDPELSASHKWLLDMHPPLAEKFLNSQDSSTRAAWVKELCWLTDEQFLAALAEPRFAAFYLPKPVPVPHNKEAEAAREKEVGKLMRIRAFYQGLDHLRGITELDDHELQRLNDRYTLVKDFGGKVRVCSWYDDTQLGHKVLRALPTSEWEKGYDNQFVKTWTEKVDKSGESYWVPKETPLGKWWLKHGHRNTKERAVFAPGKDVRESEFQLWQGWRFEPNPGNLHHKFMLFVMDIVCGGEQEEYDYLYRWMANAVQNPHRPGYSAVILRTKEEGTGKGFFGKHFGALFGHHYMAVGNGKHITGNFNSHLRTCILLLADEALFHGNHEQQNLLKNIITEPQLAIEGKGLDVEMSPNCIHLLIASNEHKVVHAGVDSRRFFVPSMSNAWVGPDEKWRFAEIEEDLQRGGYESLLDELLNFDLGNWRAQPVPLTKGLEEQRALGNDDPLKDRIEELLEAAGVSPETDVAIASKCMVVALGKQHLNGRQLEPVATAMYAAGFAKTTVRNPDGKSVKAYKRGGDAPVWLRTVVIPDANGWTDSVTIRQWD